MSPPILSTLHNKNANPDTFLPGFSFRGPPSLTTNVDRPVFFAYDRDLCDGGRALEEDLREIQISGKAGKQKWIFTKTLTHLRSTLKTEASS
ncbi:hypothetical protein V1478_018365 [Vespula squamosa]|uniref:Uncharacterized protein n=1 Tax=Vespula squamosa TaxID=30214 RepID=A0ABD1ZXC5_VESSQ